MCSFVSILFKAIDLLSFLILEVSLDFEWISRKEGFNSFIFCLHCCTYNSYMQTS